MKNNYETPEVAEIGRARDVIFGNKINTTPYESSVDLWFQPLQEDD